MRNIIFISSIGRKICQAIIFAAALCVLFSSCTSKNASKSSTETAVSKEVKKAVSDTGTVKTKLTTETTTTYGDKRTAALHCTITEGDSTAPAQSDSAESAGIKGKGTLVNTPGGYKVQLDAIAKPVSNVTR